MWDLFLKGGPLMWPIAACSLVSVAIIVERWALFLRLRADDGDVVARAADLIRQGRAEEARRACAAGTGPVATVLVEVCGALDQPPEQRDQVASVAGSRELRSLEARLRALASIARVAPLLGLLGTVVGLVEAFMVVASHGGQVEPSLLASGIWQALLTTVAGLVVAIPATLFHDWFEGRVDEVAFAITEAVTRVTTEASHGARTAPGPSRQEGAHDGVPAKAAVGALAGSHAVD